ncbi:pilin [Alloalcanivorax sp. C16-1]|uniref:pilin n=1 Tax=Alloalcanivorax sp. C16-1 TaxID=3390051 RepID=UPI003970A621
MKQVQKGFTLIELMIVVAIIGILAAVALPAYQDYTTRAKISECVTAIAACKTSVTEYYSSQGSFPADADAAGCSSNETQYCGEPSVEDGEVTVQVKTAAGVDQACDLVLTPNEDANNSFIESWSGSTACDTKYVPANFRS